MINTEIERDQMAKRFWEAMRKKPFKDYQMPTALLSSIENSNKQLEKRLNEITGLNYGIEKWLMFAKTIAHEEAHNLVSEKLAELQKGKKMAKEETERRNAAFATLKKHEALLKFVNANYRRIMLAELIGYVDGNLSVLNAVDLLAESLKAVKK